MMPPPHVRLTLPTGRNFGRKSASSFTVDSYEVAVRCGSIMYQVRPLCPNLRDSEPLDSRLMSRGSG